MQKLMGGGRGYPVSLLLVTQYHTHLTIAYLNNFISKHSLIRKIPQAQKYLYIITLCLGGDLMPQGCCGMKRCLGEGEGMSKHFGGGVEMFERHLCETLHIMGKYSHINCIGNFVQNLEEINSIKVVTNISSVDLGMCNNFYIYGILVSSGPRHMNNFILDT